MEKYNLDEKGGLFKFNEKRPSKVVKNGEAIELKHHSLLGFVKASVLEATDTSVKIQGKEKITDLKFSPNDHILLHYKSSNDIFVLTGEIASVDKTDPLEVTIRVSKIEKHKDIAKEKRCCTSLTGAFKIIGVPESKFAAIKMMSLGGIKANCKEDIMLEDMVEISVVMDKTNKANFKGRIVRKNKLTDAFEYGIEYSEVPESSSKLIHSALYQYETMA